MKKKEIQEIFSEIYKFLKDLEQSKDDVKNNKLTDHEGIRKEIENEPTEPVVTDEDRELACQIQAVYRKKFDFQGMWHSGEVSQIIAKARQAEREELRRLRGRLSAEERDAGSLCFRYDALQAKLTAAEARVRELETPSSLCVSSDPSFVRFANLKYKSIWINPMHVKAVVGVVDHPGCGAGRETSIVTSGDSWTIRTRESVEDVIAKLQQPATADAKGGE